MTGTLTLTGNSNTLQPVPKPQYVATVEGVTSEEPTPSTPFVVQWNEIQGKPPFGTASSRDVPAVGDAATNQVVLGSDSRLTGPRPTTVNQITDATQTGKDLLLAPGSPQARAVLGATSIGDALFTAATQLDGRNTLGLGTASTLNSPIPVANGGTAATTASGARTNLGSGATGDALFTSATAAAARPQLGLPAGAPSTIGNNILTAADAAAVRTLIEWPLMPFGQCYVTLAGSDLRLNRLNGKFIFINGTFREIPSTGPTLAPTGATPGTLYYIYAFWNGSAIALERDTAVPVIDATWGIPVKTGDATRTLVAQATPVTGPAWLFSSASKQIANWWNKKPLVSRFPLTVASIGTIQTVYTELDTGYRVSANLWTGDEVRVINSGTILNTNVTTCGFAPVSISGPMGTNLVLRGGFNYTAGGAAFAGNAHMVFEDTAPSDGRALFGVFGFTNAGTVTLQGGAAGDQACLNLITQG